MIPEETKATLTKIVGLSSEIVKQQRRADARKFRSMGDALNLQKLRRDRTALQRSLPPLRLVGADA